MGLWFEAAWIAIVEQAKNVKLFTYLCCVMQATFTFTNRYVFHREQPLQYVP